MKNFSDVVREIINTVSLNKAITLKECVSARPSLFRSMRNLGKTVDGFTRIAKRINTFNLQLQKILKNISAILMIDFQ